MTDINIFDLGKFHDFGFVQEVNREFFHPLGLALAVVVDDETGERQSLVVFDWRDDKEGAIFADLSSEDNVVKEERVARLRSEISVARIKRFGWIVQPIGHRFSDEDTTDEVEVL